MSVAKVCIVGTGFIGRAWAISFARAGHEATLWDAAPSAPAAALAYIEGLLPDLAEHDLLNGSSPAEIRRRMHVAPTLEEALAGAEPGPAEKRPKCRQAGERQRRRLFP